MDWQRQLMQLLRLPTSRNAPMPATGLPMGLAGAPLATLARPMKEGLGALSNLAGVTGELARGGSVPRSTIEEAAIKGAVGASDVAGQVGTAPVGALGTMLGREARHAPQLRLQDAENAIKAGASPQDVWHALEVDTSMPHGKPLWEIDDSAARFSPDFLKDVEQRYTSGMNDALAYPMIQVWEHPEFFANVPEMARAKVHVGDQGMPSWRGGEALGFMQPHFYNPTGPANQPAATIGLNVRQLVDNPARARLTMLHEGQHAADWVGGLPYGNNPKNIGKQATQALKNEFMNTKPGTPEFDRLVKLYQNFVSDPKKASQVLFNLYKRDPGEWQANTTMARADYTPAERAALMPWQSAERPVSDLINPQGNWSLPWRVKRP